MQGLEAGGFMELETRVLALVTLGLLSAMFIGPIVFALFLYFADRRQSQHAVLRNYPLLGRVRYLLEQVGPELRQYLFDSDLAGKPFTREGYRAILALGADAVTIARGLMISVGCIQAQRCHSNDCPVGVATTDEALMQALVVDEKKWRVPNYIITLRAGLTSLAAAAGLRSPTQFDRRHAVYLDAIGRMSGADALFPRPERLEKAA